MERNHPRWMESPTARRVRGVMAENGINQTRLGELLGLSQAAVARRLSGNVAFRADELQALATHVGVPVGDLY